MQILSFLPQQYCLRCDLMNSMCEAFMWKRADAHLLCCHWLVLFEVGMKNDLKSFSMHASIINDRTEIGTKDIRYIELPSMSQSEKHNSTAMLTWVRCQTKSKICEFYSTTLCIFCELGIIVGQCIDSIFRIVFFVRFFQKIWLILHSADNFRD